MKPFSLFGLKGVDVITGVMLMVAALLTGWSIGLAEARELRRKNRELEASNYYLWKRSVAKPTREAVIISPETLTIENAMVEEFVSISTGNGYITQRAIIVFEATNPAVLKLLERKK